MSTPKPHARFLLRASAALIVLSAVWWVALTGPLLAGLRETAGFIGTLAFGSAPCDLITVTASGDWNICVPVAGAQSGGGSPAGSRLNSVEFELARTGPLAFTFGLPVYWAVLLSGTARRRWRPLAAGTIATSLLETILFVVFLRTYAAAVLAQPDPVRTPAVKWLFDASQYVELNVAPTLAPFLVAMYVQRDRLREMFGVARRNRARLEQGTDRVPHFTRSASVPPPQSGLEPVRGRPAPRGRQTPERG
jgi:hypothetical protein